MRGEWWDFLVVGLVTLDGKKRERKGVHRTVPGRERGRVIVRHSDWGCKYVNLVHVVVLSLCGFAYQEWLPLPGGITWGRVPHTSGTKMGVEAAAGGGAGGLDHGQRGGL